MNLLVVEPHVHFLLTHDNFKDEQAYSLLQLVNTLVLIKFLIALIFQQKTMKLSKLIICVLFLITNLAHANSFGDLIGINSYGQKSEYIIKLKLTNQSSISSNSSPLLIKSQNNKIARVLQISAIPFFIAALVTNNSRDLSRSFLLVGSGLELTSIYLHIHKEKTTGR